MTDLRHKVALVTGSSRGIGAAIAKCFARHGAKVALHGRDASALSGVAREITEARGDALPVTAELTQFSEIEAMRQKIEDTWGAIDILVANAGKSYTRPNLPLEETPEDGWRAAIDGKADHADVSCRVSRLAVPCRWARTRRGWLSPFFVPSARSPNRRCGGCWR